MERVMQYTDAARRWVGFVRQHGLLAPAALQPILDEAVRIAQERRSPRIGRIHLDMALETLYQKCLTMPEDVVQ